MGSFASWRSVLAVLVSDCVLETKANQQAQVTLAGVACVESGLPASGPGFSGCVEQRVFGTVGEKRDHHFFELLRNFSCSVDDAGTPAVRTTRLTISDGYDECLLESPDPIFPVGSDTVPAQPGFDYQRGVLAAGNDLGKVLHATAAQAAAKCEKIPECAAFTMTGSRDVEDVQDVWLKTASTGFSAADDWHTFRKKKTANVCAAKLAGMDAETKTFDVDIIREEPLVAIIRGFFSADECEDLVEAGGDLTEYDRAHTDGGGYSEYRRSYSANIYPPLDDARSNVTRVTLRMFAATRELTGYQVYPAGQEPINGVLYQREGDEYRPHCDGGCAHEPYNPGTRVATSITYCRVPDKGGATSFTVGSLKAVPKLGDMLLFAYWPDRGEQLAGPEAEHSGCPLRGGLKWIATQWYREGVHDGFNWEMANSAKRF